MPPTARSQKRRDQEILKVTCLDRNALPEVARFVMYLDAIPEWHSLRKYVASGSAEGWEGKFSSVAPGVVLSYVRIEEHWALALIRSTYA